MTYHIILPPDADHVDWLTVRQSGIGGSDIAALVGLNPWKTAYQVWCDKTMPATDDLTGNSAVEWGTRLESAVRDAFEDKHPELRVHGPIGTARSDTHPFALANIDGYTQHTQGHRSVLEIKTAGERSKPLWDNGIPAHYMAQVAWYCEVLGYPHAYVAALIGGQTYVEHEYEHDPAVGVLLMERAERFWNDHVVTRVPPSPVAADVDRLHYAWPGDKGMDAVELDGDIADAVNNLRTIKTQIRTLEGEAAGLEVRIKTALADHTAGTVDGERVVTWTPVKPRETVDAKALRHGFPDVWEAVRKTGQPSRRFTILKETT